MTSQLSYKYQSLLTEYGIEVDYIEDLGSIKKIHSNHGMLALKKTKLSSVQLRQYGNNLRYLQYKGYGFGVPIYRTKSGSYFVFDQERAAYYLMPWLEANEEEERNDHAFKLFKQLGELHARTVKEEKMTDDSIEFLVGDLTEKWKRRKEELKNFIEQCEDKTYMSPFELFFCTYFQEMIRASDFALRKIDEWKELITEKKKYRTAFIHGKPSFQHFLYNVEGHGMFINFEHGSYLPPIYDLLYFFYRSCKTYPFQTDDRFQWFQTYRKHFPITDEELTLFIAQLSYPEKMYNVITSYRTNRQSKNEIKHVQSLQRAYWQMKNIEFFLTNIVMSEQRKKEQESQSES
jgi:spore coat protein YsxE